MYNQIYDYFANNKIFTNRQLGFRFENSTKDGVTSLVIDVVKSIEKKIMIKLFKANYLIAKV